MPARGRAQRQATATTQGRHRHSHSTEHSPHAALSHDYDPDDRPLPAVAVPLSPRQLALARIQQARWQARLDGERLGVGLAIGYEAENGRLAPLAGETCEPPLHVHYAGRLLAVGWRAGPHAPTALHLRVAEAAVVAALLRPELAVVVAAAISACAATLLLAYQAGRGLGAGGAVVVAREINGRVRLSIRPRAGSNRDAAEAARPACGCVERAEAEAVVGRWAMLAEMRGLMADGAWPLLALPAS